ncbi:hypothetical protein Tco_0465782 [Tanacetum coccineum]
MVQAAGYHAEVYDFALEDWLRVEQLFQVWVFASETSRLSCEFKLRRDALSWWKAHLRTQLDSENLGSTWRGSLMARLVGATCGRCKRQARHLQVGVIETWVLDRIVNSDYTMCEVAVRRSTRAMGRQDRVFSRVLSIGVVRIGVMIRNDRIFGVRIRGALGYASVFAGQMRSLRFAPTLCTTCGKLIRVFVYKANWAMFLLAGYST